MNTAYSITKYAKDIDEAWKFWYDEIELIAQESKGVDSSRDGAVIGEIINAVTTIEDPTRCILKSPIRKLPMRYCIGELLWYLSGIPRIIDKVKAAGLQEPEFIGGEVDLRINIYRGQVDGTVDLNTAVKPPLNRRETAGKVPVNEQEQQIYKYVSENAGITTAQAMKLLGIKQRRTREILVKMVENGWLRKEGASRSTIYVKNTEE